ncbi:MAG: hypothetical protein ACHQ1D_01200 [Nitrososphaerales archaeon]
MNKTDRFFEEIDRMNPNRRKRKPGDEAMWAFRELIWKAIDEKDENFSIVETAKALGLYNAK